MLLDQVSSFENLYYAFLACRRGKLKAISYMKNTFAFGENLVEMEARLKQNEYSWGQYREFIVKDPKERLVMSAPFMDRVVHHAIHQVIDPIIDKKISDSVFACRFGRGNRAAVIDLHRVLQAYGEKRYVVKLDVTKYFPSINHQILVDKLFDVLPDHSLEHLIWSLLRSHAGYAAAGKGIPIGNLTSQLFANFFLLSLDELALKGLGCPILREKNKIEESGHYIRYMDDSIFIGREKKQVLDLIEKVLDHVRTDLKLNMGFKKVTYLANDPVPFLGFVVDYVGGKLQSLNGYKILSRNERRFRCHLRSLNKKYEENKKYQGQILRPSYIAQVRTSFESWKDLENGKLKIKKELQKTV